jgi:pyruvate,water dikinase
VIEGLPGDATRVVSGRVTPDQYRVYLREEARGTGQEARGEEPNLSPLIEGGGDLPPA